MDLPDKTMAINYYRQSGMALAVSLILLAAMTIAAVAAMSGAGLSEKIASNSQQKAISFEAAESAIASTWSAGFMVGVLNQIAGGNFNNPDPVRPVALINELSTNLDQVGTVPGVATVDLTTDIEIKYCGETSLPSGSSLNVDESAVSMVGVLLDVNGVATIDGSNAVSDHLRRGYLVRPATGRTANCATPG